MDPVEDGNLLLPSMLLSSYIFKNIEFDAFPNDFDDNFFSNLTHEDSLILDGVPGSAPSQYVLVWETALLNFYIFMQVNLKQPLTRR